ncbi:Phosphomevalonate kinase, peroxisomal [Camellia lanceoleosa]|uniref:Phosphomevalonate kinase, peroxisomal n=1 Tax=Camellia lanceoleosa TaxID=1840588 RepID=A0ACC0FZU8_9ERIC|nr:Phosphomevalonate kinase, peroxisomal [Camellia lanceoleosa]
MHRSEKWVERTSEPSEVEIVKALLGARDTMLQIRCHMRLMGEAAGIPIEPESQTELLDATMNMEGVLLAGVPGAGGFDAVFAVTLGNSSSNVTKAWGSLNVLALLVREDPHGVSLESSDPRTKFSKFVNSLKNKTRWFQWGFWRKLRASVLPWVNAETIAQDGDPKQAICDAVKKYNINLLVLSDHELGKVKRLVLSSSNLSKQCANPMYLLSRPSYSDLIDVIFLNC